jgi:hypothetical protein
MFVVLFNNSRRVSGDKDKRDILVAEGGIEPPTYGL